jgi:hypothetical protein
VTSWENASQSELRAAADAISREYARREQLAEAERAEKFAGEVEEIKAGRRTVGPEHVRALTPAETVDAINKGLVPGVGADRRLRRGR